MACTLARNHDDSLPNQQLDDVRKSLISKRCVSRRASVHRSGRKQEQCVISCNLQRKSDLEGVARSG